VGPNFPLVMFLKLRVDGVLGSWFWVLAEDFLQSRDGARAENYTLRTKTYTIRAIFVRNGRKRVALSFSGIQMNGRRGEQGPA